MDLNFPVLPSSVQYGYPGISVIVPVYNTVAYLERCVSSILVQSLPPVQVILVDDGSSDGSAAVCDRLATQHRVIQVLHQENNGPAAARRAGVSCAVGEYFAFVDSDDAIHPRMYEILYMLRRTSGADITCGSFFETDGFEICFQNVPDELEYIRITGMARFESLLRDRDMMLSLNNKLYPAALFSGLDWAEKLHTHEDLYLNQQLFSKVGIVTLCRYPLYCYFHRPCSLSNSSITGQRIDDILFVARAFQEQAVGNPEMETLASGCYYEKLLYCYTQTCRVSNLSPLTTVRARLRAAIRERLRHILRSPCLRSLFKAAALGIVYFRPAYTFFCRRIFSRPLH